MAMARIIFVFIGLFALFAPEAKALKILNCTSPAFDLRTNLPLVRNYQGCFSFGEQNGQLHQFIFRFHDSGVQGEPLRQFDMTMDAWQSPAYSNHHLGDGKPNMFFNDVFRMRAGTGFTRQNGGPIEFRRSIDANSRTPELTIMVRKRNNIWVALDAQGCPIEGVEITATFNINLRMGHCR